MNRPRKSTGYSAAIVVRLLYLAGGGQLMLHCTSNPRRDGTVIALGCLTHTRQQFRRKAHRDGSGHASASANRRTLWLLVLRARVELMFMGWGHEFYARPENQEPQG